MWGHCGAKKRVGLVVGLPIYTIFGAALGAMKFCVFGTNVGMMGLPKRNPSLQVQNFESRLGFPACLVEHSF